MYYLIEAVIIFIFGFLVGRNNPSLDAVNKLIAAGKVVVNVTGEVVAAIKKI